MLVRHTQIHINSYYNVHLVNVVLYAGIVKQTLPVASAWSVLNTVTTRITDIGYDVMMM